MDSGLCGGCQKPFVRIHSAKRKWCSDKCKAAAARARAEADGRAAQWYATTLERKRKQPETVACEQCGELYERLYSSRKYCSRKCGSRAYALASRTRESRRLAKLDYARRRRALKRGVDAERFRGEEIFERDGWVCKICNVPTIKDAKVPNYYAPTVDHILPLAQGGPHTRANVQTAHFICNSLKSDSIAKEVTDARTAA